MSKIGQTAQDEAVIAASDKPVIFYKSKEQVEM
jgi:hypothetical protein